MAFQKNTTLRSLDLSDNQLPPKDFNLLLQGLCSNSTLTTLRLGERKPSKAGHPMDESNIAALCHLLQVSAFEQRHWLLLGKKPRGRAMILTSEGGGGGQRLGGLCFFVLQGGGQRPENAYGRSPKHTGLGWPRTPCKKGKIRSAQKQLMHHAITKGSWCSGGPSLAHIPPCIQAQRFT